MKKIILIISMLISTHYLMAQCVPDIDANLVASYIFNGDANDVSGNGNHGTINNGMLVADRFNTQNAAYKFSGDGNVLIPDNARFNGTSGTWAGWFNIATPSTGWGYSIMSKGSYGNRLMIGTYDSLLLCQLQADNRITKSFDAGTYTINNWNHFCITWTDTSATGGIAKLYKNAILSFTQRYSGNLNLTTGSSLELGTNDDRYWEQYNGALDDVRVYDRALSDCDVDSLYHIKQIITGVNDIRNSVAGMSLYPNPSTGFITVNINSETEKNTEMEVSNISGQIVLKKPLHITKGINHITIDLDTKGVYFVKVFNSVNKIIIE